MLAIESAKALLERCVYNLYIGLIVSRVPLPVAVDLALCRDALQLSEAVRMLRNLAAA